MEHTIRKNLDIMKGARTEGHMEYLLTRESFGGNAGYTSDGRSCAEANFYFDKTNGEIKYFGNFQNVPEQIRSKYSSGSFRVALDSKIWRLEIVDMFYSMDEFPHRVERISDTSEVSDAVKKVLKLTVELYNSKAGH